MLHTDTLTARVDSCSVVQGTVVPPAPPPAPPPPPPPTDTVVVSVKVSPNPVTIASGKSFQLTGGAYNAAGQLTGKGLWYSDNAGVVGVDQTGKITGVAPGTTNVEFRYSTKTAWSTVTDTGKAIPTPPPTSSLAPADSFTRSVGVAAHFSYNDLAPYSSGRISGTVDSAISLGAGFLRDGIQINNPTAWNAEKRAIAGGMKILVVTQPAKANDYLTQTTVDSAVKQLTPSGILAFEGPNEVDNNNGGWGGIPAYGPNVKTFQCAVYARVHATAPGVPVISPTVTSAVGASYMADLTACADAGTLHPYPSGGIPTASLAATSAFTSSFVKGKPQWVTETGYYTSPTATTNAYQPGVSEIAAAKYITREYLDYFQRGIPHTSTYELIDERDDKTNAEMNYGLLHNNGSAKPAYTALRSMLKLLADPGPSYTLPSCAASFTGTTSTIRTLALAKRNGNCYFILWNDVSVFNTNTKVDVSNPTVGVGVSLSKKPSALAIYFPVTAPAAASLTPAQSFTVSVQDSPLILEVKP